MCVCGEREGGRERAREGERELDPNSGARLIAAASTGYVWFISMRDTSCALQRLGPDDMDHV
jgi:hypothetical protein